MFTRRIQIQNDMRTNESSSIYTDWRVQKSYDIASSNPQLITIFNLAIINIQIINNYLQYDSLSTSKV